MLPRRAALVGAGLCALAGTGLAAVEDGRLTLGSGPTRTQATRRAADPGGFSRVRTSAPVVALTFDDGPDPAYTPTVLDLLARAGAQATFFCVGTNVEAHPAIVERIVREGHLLANHTHDHAPLESILGREVERQVRDGRSALVEVAGLRAGSVQGARFLRPPRGFTTPNVARIAGRLDERGAYWSLCLEANGAGDDRSTGARVGALLDPGDVLLAHDGGHVSGRWGQVYDRSTTVAALPYVLETLAARGLRSVRLDQLVGSGRPV